MLLRMFGAAVLLLALAAPGLAAVASAQTLTRDQKLELFKAAQKEVLGYTQFSIFDSVHARVSDTGVVELFGKVTMPYKRNDIERRVARAAGVQRVENRIEVLPVSSYDNELRYRIARAIYSNPHFVGYGSMVNPPIHIIVERGRVTLEGVVNSNVDRMLARSIASSFMSIGAVKVDLKTDAEAREELEKL